MAENEPQYPPETPYSAQDIYDLVRHNPHYADFIREQLAQARTASGEEQIEALNTLDQHFALSTQELTFLALPTGFSIGPCCTDTKPALFLLDFATATANYPPGEQAE